MLVPIPLGFDRQVCLEEEGQFHRDFQGDTAPAEEVTDDLREESGGCGRWLGDIG
ncbi:hypothetical protein HED50_23845 [Ochrobactrum oryzae]|nr:hypothetical protein [Brucella oryzae]